MRIVFRMPDNVAGIHLEDAVRRDFAASKASAGHHAAAAVMAQYVSGGKCYPSGSAQSATSEWLYRAKLAEMFVASSGFRPTSQCWPFDSGEGQSLTEVKICAQDESRMDCVQTLSRLMSAVRAFAQGNNLTLAMSLHAMEIDSNPLLANKVHEPHLHVLFVNCESEVMSHIVEWLRRGNIECVRDSVGRDTDFSSLWQAE